MIELPAPDRTGPVVVPEGVSSIVKEILPFFHNFNELDAFQKQTLIKKIDNAGTLTSHRNNIMYAQQFVEKIWKVCSVKVNPIDGMVYHNKLALEILNYSKWLTFANLFLNIVRFSKDIGLCVSNPVIMFGRGIAYLSDSVSAIGQESDT